MHSSISVHCALYCLRVSGMINRQSCVLVAYAPQRRVKRHAYKNSHDAGRTHTGTHPNRVHKFCINFAQNIAKTLPTPDSPNTLQEISRRQMTACMREGKYVKGSLSTYYRPVVKNQDMHEYQRRARAFNKMDD